MTKRKKQRSSGPGRGEADRRRRAAARRAAEEAAAEAAAEAQMQAALEWAGRMQDPATPVPEVVEMLLRHYAGEAVMPELARLLASKGASLERIAALAAVLTEADDDPESVTALSFFAVAAKQAGDLPAARQALNEMLARRPDPDEQLMLTYHLSYCGRDADALDIIEPLLRNDPTDEVAVNRYGGVLETTYERVTAQEPAGRRCECGSELPYADCCRPREQAALDRFANRGAMYALRDALIAWLPDSGHIEGFVRHIAAWMEPFDDPHGEISEETRAALAELAGEHAWVVAGGSDDEDDEDDEDEVTPLTGFIDDPDTPAELSALAQEWRLHVHYGLWLVEFPTPAPGLWLTDIATGTVRYVALAPEQCQGIVRWAVLLAAIVPVDGVWRLGRSAVQLSPTEADAACATVLVATRGIANALTGRGSRKQRDLANAPLAFGRAEPYGVYSLGEDALPEPVARLTGSVTASLFPRLVGEVLAHRATPPTLTNTDGEPMSLITARVRVRDGAALARQLAEHPDFDTDDEGSYSWFGAEVPAAQYAAMLAEMRAQFRAEGRGEVEPTGPDARPGRWVRGRLRADGDELNVEVNSRQRLDLLLDVLHELGVEPQLFDESRVDPGLDFAWPAGPMALPGGAASPEDGWEAHWLDDAVPALHALTPRAAAAGRAEDVARLETLLREFEYQGGLLTLAGRRGSDVGWLRDALDMPAD